MSELIIIMDFGGQYSHLIARRVRECHVYCEVVPYTTSAETIRRKGARGIIFTGGPNSVYDANAPKADPAVFQLGLPILGICYGCQLLAQSQGGRVTAAAADTAREYGKTETWFDTSCKLFQGLPEKGITWMSHSDYMEKVPEGFSLVAHSAACPNVAICNEEKGFYGVQFHPEVEHTAHGQDMLKNFLYCIAGCSGDWEMKGYVERTIAQLRDKLQGKKVLCALSGGVDSTVAAVLVHQAVGSNLTCVFVDHGLLRKNEGDDVERMCKTKFNMNFVRVNAQEYFLQQLAGVTEPEQKRRIIGEAFIRTFEQEAKKLGKMDVLIQGTIYPDVIESGSGDSAVIKSHHNVGALPDVIDFEEIVEPLRLLFKDEVRQAGLELGIDPALVWRQPFPGPGLAVRILGEVTEDKLAILREADAIFREEIQAAGMDREINQYFAVLTNIRSVGVMGDFRTYDYAIGLRGVTTSDFMTADFARIPYEVLERVSSRIVNEVPHVNRIVYDITAKPPATIEWE